MVSAFMESLRRKDLDRWPIQMSCIYAHIHVSFFCHAFAYVFVALEQDGSVVAWIGFMEETRYDLVWLICFTCMLTIWHTNPTNIWDVRGVTVVAVFVDGWSCLSVTPIN